ncbi:hypothetical protein SCUP234_11615 [Seiridium cupressi]
MAPRRSCKTALQLSTPSIFGNGSDLPSQVVEPIKIIITKHKTTEEPAVGFHEFGCFPVEIRLKIWHAAILADSPERFVPLQLNDIRPALLPHKRLLSPYLSVNFECRNEALRYFFTLRVPVYQHINFSPKSPILKSKLRRQRHFLQRQGDRSYRLRSQQAEIQSFPPTCDMRTIVQGRQIGTLYLSPEYDTFVRGLPNAAFNGLLFDVDDIGPHPHGVYYEEYARPAGGFSPNIDKRQVASFAIPDDKFISQIRRLAVAQYYSTDKTHTEVTASFKGRIDSARATSPNFWNQEHYYPGVREHFTFFTSELRSLTKDIFCAPQNVLWRYEMRRWSAITDHPDLPNAGTLWFMAKKRTDGFPQGVGRDEPEDFDFWDIHEQRRVPWGKTPAEPYLRGGVPLEDL